MARLHVLRVFCNEDGLHGNPLGVFLDGSEVPPERRQEVARRLNFSETVFVDDPDQGRIAIYTPALQIEFAGHPTVGTAWLLAREGSPVEVLRPPAGEAPARADGDGAHVAGRPEWGPPLDYVELGSAAEVEALDGPPDGRDFVSAWAWADEERGLVRARVFVDRFDIREDEATGLAALKLADRLGRPIEIRQGRGSRILARPLGDGMVEIGGRVVLDEMREDPG